MQVQKEDKTRTGRLQKIHEILESMRVESQAELLLMLEQQGFSCTQATLSRDFRQLHVVKRRLPSGKKYYAVQKQREKNYQIIPENGETAPNFPIPGFRTIAFSGNMAVVRTLPGYASSVAYHIDACMLPEILGTIAGDDTVFCVIQEGVIPAELIHKLEACFESDN